MRIMEEKKENTNYLGKQLEVSTAKALFYLDGIETFFGYLASDQLEQKMDELKIKGGINNDTIFCIDTGKELTFTASEAISRREIQMAKLQAQVKTGKIEVTQFPMTKTLDDDLKIRLKYMPKYEDELNFYDTETGKKIEESKYTVKAEKEMELSLGTGNTGITALSDVTLDKDVFKSKTSLSKSLYTFSYGSSSWSLESSSATLSDYGISVTGTPTAGDEIIVTVSETGSAIVTFTELSPRSMVRSTSYLYEKEMSYADIGKTIKSNVGTLIIKKPLYDGDGNITEWKQYFFPKVKMDSNITLQGSTEKKENDEDTKFTIMHSEKYGIDGRIIFEKAEDMDEDEGAY